MLSGIQWAIQIHRPNDAKRAWRSRSYYRSKAGLLSCVGEPAPPELLQLPDWFLEAPAPQPAETRYSRPVESFPGANSSTLTSLSSLAASQAMTRCCHSQKVRSVFYRIFAERRRGREINLSESQSPVFISGGPGRNPGPSCRNSTCFPIAGFALDHCRQVLSSLPRPSRQSAGSLGGCTPFATL
jgi:hypothetical protein